jgi:hypothetical protein
MDIVKDGMVIDPIIQNEIIARVVVGHFGDQPSQTIRTRGNKVPNHTIQYALHCLSVPFSIGNPLAIQSRRKFVGRYKALAFLNPSFSALNRRLFPLFTPINVSP